MEVHINAWGLSQSYRALESLEVQTDFIRDEMFIATKQEKDVESGYFGSQPHCTPYNGQYDNLFFFFTHMYHLIHNYYDHNELKAYRRPIS